ncbi:MAG TPA: TCR/Tet family MFS transporter [Candidatus Saccharimonadales bacterium]|nr:TCR/Tet family MFS transporter [Candidatus Saccharimonadales bacterium]
MSSRKPAVAFIFVTLVIDILGIGLIIPILPNLVASFVENHDVSKASTVYGLLAALYSLMQFLFAPILGSLSDHYGRRPVLLVSLLGAGLDYFLLAYAPSLSWFFVGRIIAGITGANIATASAYIADVTPPEKRAAAFGLIGAAFGIGFVAGPALGGVLGDVGLRVPFLVAGGLAMLNWVYGLIILPESLPKANRRAFSWRRANPIGSLAALRRHPVVLGLAGTHFLAYLGHQVLPSMWVLYTGYRYGWKPKQTGLSLAIVGIMAGVVQGGLTKIIVRRIGEQKALIFGLSVAALAYAAYGLATEGWMIYVILVWASLGGVAGPAIQSLITRNVEANEQGAVQGALTSLGSVAGIVGPIMATALFAYFISQRAPVHMPGVPFFFSAVLTVIGILLAVRSFRSTSTSVPHSGGAAESTSPQPTPAEKL